MVETPPTLVATANLHWRGPGNFIARDVADLEVLAKLGAVIIGCQELQADTVRRFLAANSDWAIAGGTSIGPAYRVVGTFYRRDLLDVADYLPVAVPIGKLGPAGAGEDEIKHKVITVVRFTWRATGAVFWHLNTHAVVSAFRKGIPAAERGRRLAAWTKQISAYMAVVRDAKRLGIPVMGGLDANAIAAQLAALTVAGWTWLKTGPTIGGRAIDLLGSCGMTLGEPQLVRGDSDHLYVVAPFTPPTPPDARPAPPKEIAVAKLPATLPNALRAAGLKVVEHDGWQTRGRPASTGGFDPVGVLCHHTATGPKTSDAATVRLLVDGRSDLPGPLSHLGLARDGTVHVIAAGRANHAGKAKASGTVAAGDGNELYIGIEAFNDGRGEKWPAAQYDAYVKLAAVLCQTVTGNSAETVRGHKETSVTGKIDPTFPMDAFRRRVAEQLAGPASTQRPRPKPEPKPEPPNHPGNLYRALIAALDDGEPKIDKGRTEARAWAKTVRAAVAAGKKFTS